MSDINLLSAALILWGIVTAVLAALWIYRSIVGLREEDQLFIGAGETNMEREQALVRSRLDRLGTYLKACGVASGFLLLTSGGLWFYQMLNSGGIAR